MSERERYFILGSYHDMVGQDEQAATAYEALLKLHPDHFGGMNNLGSTYSRLASANPGGYADLRAGLWARRADLRPTHLVWALVAAENLLNTGDAGAAEPYIERARALVSAEGTHPQRVVQASLLKVHAAWVGRDAGQMLAALNEVVASGPPQTSAARDRWLYEASLGYVTLGMLDTAHDMGLQIASEWQRCEVLYQVALARDDRQAARDPLRCLARHARLSPGIRTEALIWLARAGARDEAREVLEWLKAQPVDRGRYKTATMGLSPAQVVAALMTTVRGELARLEGRLGEAIPLLEQGLGELQLNNLNGWTLSYLASDSLALAWLAQGEPSQAARVLDEAAQALPARRTALYGFSWLTVELRRAQVYRQLGRVAEAEQIESGLRTLLAHADPDHVILRELTPLS